MLVSRNITIDGRRTSIRLEPAMWYALEDICRRERTTRGAICSGICAQKQEDTTLTAALRVFIVAYFRVAATEEGHLKAGHAAKRATDPIPGVVKQALHSGADDPCPQPFQLSMNKLNPLLDMLDEETGRKLLGALATLDALPPGKTPPLH